MDTLVIPGLPALLAGRTRKSVTRGPTAVMQVGLNKVKPNGIPGCNVGLRIRSANLHTAQHAT